MERGRTYTENELGEISEIEKEVRSIFYKDYIPSFLVRRANSLIAKWKILTGWVEDTTPALYEETLLDKTPNYQIDETRRHSESSSIS
jgi:hypothetical protein